jgi:hypothetical protein
MDAPAYHAIEPVYVEQLVPPHMSVQYGIKTRTPLPAAAAAATAAATATTNASHALIELLERNTDLRAFLIGHGLTPCGKLKDNRRKIDKWAEGQGKKIIYIQP